MNKKKEIMELKAEVRRLKDATTFHFYSEKLGDVLLVPVKDVVDMILKDLCLKLSRSPEKVSLESTVITPGKW